MVLDEGLEWEPCAVDGCLGVQLAQGRCWAHAADRDLDAAMRELGQTGAVDARGVPIDGELVKRLLAATYREADGRPAFSSALFHRATFTGEAEFRGTVFKGVLDCRQATFTRLAEFTGSSFLRDADFRAASFGRDAEFGETDFQDWARFDSATFQSVADFREARIRDAAFQGARFEKLAAFSSVSFRSCRFTGAIFEGGVHFGGTSFGDSADLEHARFGDQSSFHGARFGNNTRFTGASFGKEVSFEQAVFGWHSSFQEATFDGQASFQQAAFDDDASFRRARFGPNSTFSEASFTSKADFIGATFGDGVDFVDARIGTISFIAKARFGNDAKFDRAHFADAVDLHEIAFGDRASFDGTRFDGSASLTQATFGNWARLGPIVAAGYVNLDHARFGLAPRLAISADGLDCQGARFPDGASLQLRWTEVTLDGAEFGRPSVVGAAQPFRIAPPELSDVVETGLGPVGQQLDEGPLVEQLQRFGRTWRPRPVCLAGCDVTNLVLAGVDLRACQFAGAYNLALLRLEGPVVWPSTPTGWRRGGLLPWRWTRRHTVADEHQWRATTPKAAGWDASRGAHRHTDSVSPEGPRPPEEIAPLYRALRKGREDNKDEPGAADFYYGEMEMRRKAGTTPLGERAILFLYWVLSGYGLRAARAFGALALFLVVAVLLLAWIGLPAPNPASTTAQRVEQSTRIALNAVAFRSAQQQLTPIGSYVEMAARSLGAVLLGLGLLSLRGRVKR